MTPPSSPIHWSLSTSLFQQRVLPAFSKQMDRLEAEEKKIEEIFQAKTQERKEALVQIKTLKREMKKIDQEIDTSDLQLQDIFEAKTQIASSIASKRARIEPSPSPEPDRSSIEENLLLAECYTSGRIEGDVYYQGQRVQITGLDEKSNQFVFTPILENEYAPRQSLQTSREELVFCPRKDKTYLVRWSKTPTAWRGRYFAATVTEIKTMPTEKSNTVTCTVLWNETGKTQDKHLGKLNNILPFGPNHPNAQLLKKETITSREIERERYSLKKK